MFRNDKLCPCYFICPSYHVDDEFCNEDGGRMTNGRIVPCLKEVSVYYRAVDWLIAHNPLRKVEEGLTKKIAETIVKAEGIDDD